MDLQGRRHLRDRMASSTGFLSRVTLNRTRFRLFRLRVYAVRFRVEGLRGQNLGCGSSGSESVRVYSVFKSHLLLLRPWPPTSTNATTTTTTEATPTAAAAAAAATAIAAAATNMINMHNAGTAANRNSNTDRDHDTSQQHVLQR